MGRSWLCIVIVIMGPAAWIAGQEVEVNALAQAEFVRSMNETLVETVLRYEQLLEFPDDRSETTVVLDTDIERINDATLFRQTAVFPNSGFWNFADLTVYRNGPARPVRIMFGLHDSDAYFSLMKIIFPAPFQLLTNALDLLGVYNRREDVYSSIYQLNTTVWVVPYTDNFVGNYPETIRGLGGPIIGSTLREIRDDVDSDAGPPPEERSFAVADTRTVEFVDTRFFRAASAYSQLTLMWALLDALYENAAERPDGGYGEYRWFGDDGFAVFNSISFELNLAELARAGTNAARRELGDIRGPVDIYALAERGVEQLEREPETKDVTRFGTRIEQVPFIGDLSLFGYYSERNDVDPIQTAVEAGADWRLGPLLLSGNGIASPELVTGEAAVESLLEQAEYGFLAGLEFGLSGAEFRATGERRLEFGEPRFYRAQARLEAGRTGGTRFVGEATVTAPELNPDFREQRAILGLRLDNMRWDAGVVQEVVASEVENTFVTVDFTGAF